jgi:hypothetical protein
LAQQASGFRSNRGKFSFLEKPDVLICQTGQSSFRPMCSAIVCSIGSSPAKLDSLASEIGGSKISRISDKSSETMTTVPDDWRTLLVCYLKNPDHITDRKVR